MAHDPSPVAAVTSPGRPERLLTPLFLRVVLVNFVFFVSVGALVPAIPLFVEGPLAGGSVAVGAVVGVYAFGALLAGPLAGRISDRRGRRGLILAGGLFASAVTASYALVTEEWMLGALRFMAGAGEATLFVGTASIINDLAPDSRRGEAISLFSLSVFAGVSVGPLIGETLVEGPGFDITFLVVAALPVLAVLLALGFQDTRPPGETGTYDRLLHRAALVPGIVLAASVWGFSGFSAFMPLYAPQAGLDGSRFVFLAYGTIVIVIRSLGASVPDRLGPWRTIQLALATSTVGLLVMGLWESVAGVFTGASLFAVGQSLAFPGLMTLAIRAAPASERGAIVGTMAAAFDTAYGLGAVTMGGAAAAFGYRGVFLAASGVAASGAVLLFLRRRAEAAPAGPDAQPV
jgi:predicted MFS family arabinose efflux permease